MHQESKLCEFRLLTPGFVFKCINGAHLPRLYSVSYTQTPSSLSSVSAMTASLYSRTEQFYRSMEFVPFASNMWS